MPVDDRWGEARFSVSETEVADKQGGKARMVPVVMDPSKTLA